MIINEKNKIFNNPNWKSLNKSLVVDLAPLSKDP